MPPMLSYRDDVYKHKKCVPFTGVIIERGPNLSTLFPKILCPPPPWRPTASAAPGCNSSPPTPRRRPPAPSQNAPGAPHNGSLSPRNPPLLIAPSIEETEHRRPGLAPADVRYRSLDEDQRNNCWLCRAEFRLDSRRPLVLGPLILPNNWFVRNTNACYQEW